MEKRACLTKVVGFDEYMFDSMWGNCIFESSSILSAINLVNVCVATFLWKKHVKWNCVSVAFKISHLMRILFIKENTINELIFSQLCRKSLSMGAGHKKAFTWEMKKFCTELILYSAHKRKDPQKIEISNSLGEVKLENLQIEDFIHA